MHTRALLALTAAHHVSCVPRQVEDYYYRNLARPDVKRRFQAILTAGSAWRRLFMDRLGQRRLDTSFYARAEAM